MSQSSSIWMTSSFTLIICVSARPMFRKYSEDSKVMDFLPEPISVSFMLPPVNTLDICCHPKTPPWHHTKSRISRIGPNPGRSKTFNPSSVLPTSTDASFMDTVKNWFSNPTKVQEGWDCQGKDIMDDRQGKALREGCHERR